MFCEVMAFFQSCLAEMDMHLCELWLRLRTGTLHAPGDPSAAPDFLMLAPQLILTLTVLQSSAVLVQRQSP